MIGCCTFGAQMYSLGGGNATLLTVYNTCDKTDMTAETTAAVSSGNLSSNRYGAGAAANPGTAAYICAGNTSTTVSVATGDKLTFSNDTTTGTSSANLSVARSQIAAISERSTKCYMAGGLVSGGGVVKKDTCDIITFSTDTAAGSASAKLTAARSGVSGLNGDSTKGYWAGGTTSGVFNAVVTGEKLTFSSDTTATAASANLSFARLQMQSGADGSTKGFWFCGQGSAGASTVVDSIVVSTDTTSATTSATTGWAYAAAGSSDGNNLISLGGNNAGGSANAAGSKISFSTNTTSSLGGGSSLSQARQVPVGLSTVAL